ncbi:MAG: c-type cytochrome [Pirellulales bacterium]|nr:c-type cytochrome [Pirellulales bacterium]
MAKRPGWNDGWLRGLAAKLALMALGGLHLFSSALHVRGEESFDPTAVVDLLEIMLEQQAEEPDTVIKCLDVLSQKIETREVTPAAAAELRPRLQEPLQKILAGPSHIPLFSAAARLAAGLGDPAGRRAMRQVLADAKSPVNMQLAALSAVVAEPDDTLFNFLRRVFPAKINPADAPRPEYSEAQLISILQTLDRSEATEIAEILLAGYPHVSATLQPQVLELLTHRAAWSRALLASIEKKELPATILNTNQIRRMLTGNDAELSGQIKNIYGTIRTDRNPQREQVLLAMRDAIRRHPPGNALTGEKVFQRVCGQCHKLHGVGQDVGPDITLNGRNSFEQLLSNVFDPSLVIGAAYQAQIVETTDGLTLTGLVAEDNDQRLVLKLQGGKLEIIPRQNIAASFTSPLSLMPEELEKQFSEQELRDLFAYLTLDKHPSDPAAVRLPGVYPPQNRTAKTAAAYPELVNYIAAGFQLNGCGEGGLVLLEKFRDQPDILQTHPLGPEQPAIMAGEFAIPAYVQAMLKLAVTHHPDGDWRLVVRGNGQVLLDRIIGPTTSADPWHHLAVDLSQFAGGKVQLELENSANNWAWEFGYWREVRLEFQPKPASDAPKP